jgi:cellulose synthase/poly-beta-1,6-N-acetylglucosamine synthase-like glycosyltransferase
LGHLAFRLHDRLSGKLDANRRLKHVTGDIVSIRRELVTERPAECVNDDEYLAIHTVRKGFRVAYLRKILYKTPMPITLLDYLNQRRRWVYGHLQLGKMLGEYPSVLECVSVKRPFVAASVVVEEIAEKLSDLPLFVASFMIEFVVAILVLKDVILKVKHSPWQTIDSTKRKVA